MSEQTIEIDDEAPVPEPAAEAPAETDDELLVEEVSIDGMCGVY
jgi:mycofactocin precursor